MRRLWLACTTLALVACAHTAPPPLEDAGAFQALSAIEGDWRDETAHVLVHYELVSRGSALLEDYRTASGTRTLTVYHPDHETVRLTHYCAQGNQARLVLTARTGSRLVFERDGVTNLLPDQAVLTELSLELEGGVLIRTEVYVDESGARESTTTRFEHPSSGAAAS